MEVRRVVKPEHVLLEGDGYFKGAWPCAIVPVEDVLAAYHYTQSYDVNDPELVELVERAESPHNFKLYDRLRDGKITDPNDDRSRVRLYAAEFHLFGVGIKRSPLGLHIDSDPNRVGLWSLREIDIYKRANLGSGRWVLPGSLERTPN